jgi:aerobic-type carbon monoxide dehydrogenase small subunit (CoxS/CutS family)
MFKRLFTTALVFGMAAIGPPAFAMPCATRDDMAAALTQSYKETLTARGLQSSTSVMEIWTSGENGSFTVLVTNAQGIACIVATGTHWMTETTVETIEGTPS